MTPEFTTGQIRPIECFKKGWELIKPQYWMIFAITLVGMLIASIGPFGVLIGPMYCGIYLVILRTGEGKAADFNDLFKGFNYFGQSLIATLVLIVPVLVSMAIMWFSMAGIMFSATNGRGQLNESAIFALYGTMMVEGLIMAVIMSCIQALIMFAYPLIIERQLSGFDALKLSARAAWANLGSVVSIILCECAIGFVGYLLCGVGLYLTLPIMFAGVFMAYRTVFPAPRVPSLEPPPPTAYPELA